jgi:hypothetical protein
MFGRFPGEEQGEAVKDVLRTNNPSKRMADPLEIAKLALPRVGRFCVRRRGRLLDRRRGLGHFGRGRLSLVAESRGCSCSRSGKGRLAPAISSPDYCQPMSDMGQSRRSSYLGMSPSPRLRTYRCDAANRAENAAAPKRSRINVRLDHS